MATEKEIDNCLTVAEHIGTVEQGLIETGDEVTIAEEKKIIQKIDRRLVTAVAIMFSVSLIDRTNLAGANIAGLSKELHLDTGYRYSLAILVFFIPHVMLQWPGVLLVTKFGPRLVLPTMVVLWGCITLCFGFMKNWEQMIGLRVLVGAFEAGLLPGCILLLQVWYRRYDVHKRFSLFYGGSICGSSLSGILAYGFMHMGGVGGLSGWRYIFIWEGVLTILIGFMSAFLIVDFPQNAQRSWRFLDPRELRHVLSMLEADRKDVASEPLSKSHLVAAVLDVKIWAFSVIYFASTVMAYAIAYFAPIILNQKMGYSVGVSQLLSTPPFFFAGAFMYAQGWIGDKYRARAPIVIWNAIQGICGLSLLTWPDVAGVQYFGLFLLASAANASIPCAMAYQANNICGQGKRTVASACMVVLGGIGGIVGALVFRSQDAPRYLPGIYSGLGCCGIQLVVTCFLTMYLRAQNRRAAKGDLVLEGIPGFRYTL